MNKVNIIVIAAGHGKRMNSDRPKPLVELGEKPMIQHILDAIAGSGICDSPVVVVSPDNIHLFKETIGDNPHQFAIQQDQLGTGHATQSACSLLDMGKPTIVLNGDSPMISSEMIQKILAQHVQYEAVVTLGVVTVPSFDGWYVAFKNWGRIVRDKDGKVQQIMEAKDATQEQLEIKEVNPTYFCFNSKWMCNRLQTVSNNNAQKEYYLTDLIKMAVAENQTVASSPVTPEEGIGVNTLEHRQMAEDILNARKS